MAKTTSSLGDITQAMLEKRLLPTGTKGTYLLPGTDETVRGKSNAVKALVKAAGADDATATTRNALSQAEIAQQVHDLAEQGKTQKEIAETVSMDITHVGDLLRWAGADPIIWQDEDELQKKIVAERDKEKTSWAGIAICAGITKGRAQRLYREAGKDPHKSDIGKGGRRKDTYHSGPKKSAAKPKAKSGAKKSTGKKKASSKSGAKKKTTSSKKKATSSKKASTKSEDTPF